MRVPVDRGIDRAAGPVRHAPGEGEIAALEIAGAAVIALAVAWAYRHVWNKAFMQRLDRYSMSAEVKTGVERAGQAGYAARAIVAAITGVFLIVAGAEHDPQEAVGLSGALGALAGEPWGQAVLWVVAIGLFLYGCFCFAEAKYRRAV